MDRRAFVGRLALGILVVPLGAEAQQAVKVYRIGVLLAGSRGENTSYIMDAFRQALRGLGYVEGRNITIEYRFVEGRLDRAFDLASELARLPVDVIVAPGTAVAQAARKATTTIPIVLVTAGNPVGDGLIKSFARPGGNATGLTMAVGQEIGGKLLQLLKEAVPTVSRVAVLWNPLTAPNAARASAAHDVHGARLCNGRRSDVVWIELLRGVSARRGVCRQDSQRRQA